MGFDGGTPMPVARDESQPCQLGANGWQLSGNGTRIVLRRGLRRGAHQPRRALHGVRGYDAGSIDEWADGGFCVQVGRPCQLGGARCCFGLECTPAGDGGPSCDSVIN